MSVEGLWKDRPRNRFQNKFGKVSHKNRAKICCVKPLLISLIFAVSFPAVGMETLSWRQCVDSVVQNNAILRASQASVRATKYKEGGARSGFFPEISAGLNYNRAKGDATDSRYSGSLSLSQDLFHGFQDIGQVRQAEANTAAARAQLQMDKAQASYDLKSAFEGVLYAKEYQKLTQEIIKRREDNLHLVRLRFENGQENKGSVLLSRAYLNDAHLSELKARDVLRVAGTQLAKVIGRDGADPIDVQGQVPLGPAPTEQRPDFKKIAIATPAYQQALARERAADQAVTVARSQFYPDLKLTGALGRSGAEFFPNQDSTWSLGVGLSVPLFSGGKDYYNTESAISSRVASESQRIDVSRDLLSSLEQAYSNYLEADAQLKVDESYKEAAIVRAEIARKRYNTGLINFDDWDVIENDLIKRETSYLQSKRNRVTAEAAWEQTQGKGVIP